MLAFLICIVGHQLTLFLIGRWTIDIEGWRALFTTMAGVAGLSIGSVILPTPLAPLGAVILATIIMLAVYEMERWQRLVVTVAWYVFPFAALLLAGMFFGEAEDDHPNEPPPSKEKTIETLKEWREGDTKLPSPSDEKKPTTDQ